jgi:uncharacterized protein (DUF305 family)
MLVVLAAGLMGADAIGRQDSGALFNEEDMIFLQHMILHHEQAVAMADLAPSRTNRTEFIRFTGYVKRAQAAEVDLMRHWLDLAADRGLKIPSHGPHGDPPMAGMLSTAQMEALAAARGAEFERLWLEGMIFHHQGAIDMAHAQQRQQFENGRHPYGLSVLVENILVEQRVEITRMRAWLTQWGLARSTDPAR